MSNAILLISCQDQRGITAAVTQFIYEHNGNIIDAQQHIDEQSQTFFMRVEWALAGFDLAKDQITPAFQPLALKHKMNWELSFSGDKPRVAVFVSKHQHCLYDLLIRHKSGRLPCVIALIISNHPDAKEAAREFNIDYAEFPITPRTKNAQEKRELELLKLKRIDLIILARYHQILTREFIKHYANRIINIHHSFLPAFAGKSPYAQAYKKGVKIIGATSHFVTEKLDEGPIIEQDIVRINHRHSLMDLVHKGEDLEKNVLNRAVTLALEKKILTYNNKTIVFD